MERTDNPSGAVLVRRGDRALGPSSDIRDTGMLDLDTRRRLLEQRIEASKERLVADFGRAKRIIAVAKERAERGLTRVAIVAGGLLLLGLMTALVRRRHRRIRVTWR